ncbi:MAG: 30S ribosomal protein S12 methylthiotransferase RimO [Candidatus Omnitrophica bacterium]|nr:30S ribosomal protein S12 methylthiotransferase RimO [Candidatus Omnitrophota bacterium]
MIRGSRKAKVSIVSLGCPKTLVDSEVVLGHIRKKGYEISPTVEGSDISIVNTCCFIQDATQESIDTILELAELKRQGLLKGIIVAGCLPQRYREELPKEMAEVDGFVGTTAWDQIPEIVDRVMQHQRPVFIAEDPTVLNFDYTLDRYQLSPPHYSYIKISEGCDHECSFCIIPSFRGKHRSRPMDSILKEVEGLVERGVQEILLVGQDTSAYGLDLYGTQKIAELLQKIGAVAQDRWVRLHYTYPTHFSSALLEAIAEVPSVVPYIDIPLQHLADPVLRRMKRQGTRAQVYRLLERIRQRIPGVAIRSAFIVGFPGETEEDFEQLLNGMEELRFDRAGAFIFSPEEGSPAAVLPDPVPEAVKQERYDRLMSLQQRISVDRNQSWLGREVDVLVDEVASDPPGHWLGRTYADAPEIDGQVFLKTEETHPGALVRARVIDTLEYDLVAVPVEDAA